MTIVKRETLDRKLQVKTQENKAEKGEIDMASSMLDPPPKFFLSPIQTCPSNMVLRKNCPTKSNADFV